MKSKRTMSRFLCDNPTVERGEFTQTCYTDTGLAYRTDDDRDSGTESDDEGAEIEELQKYMETIIHLDSNRHQDHRRTKRLPPPQVTKVADNPPHHQPPRHHHRRRTTPRWSPGPPDSALPSDSDPHHSSEEELEVINNSHHHHHPEKRKWGGSADEEVEDEVVVATAFPSGGGDVPVEFRTSPPADVHRPAGKCLRQAHIPAHELCSVVSPRKRYRRTQSGGHHPVQRPCLDFEKMQQGGFKISELFDRDREVVSPRWLFSNM